MPLEIPDLYLKFAKILKPDDYVLTFNYDTLLERALTTAGVPFRLFPERLRQNPYGGRSMLVDTSREEVIVLKLHGSIDWFDRTDYSRLEAERVKQGFGPGGTDLVFQDPGQVWGSTPVGGSTIPG